MKLYKKKILNVNVGKCLLVSLITFVIRYFYANVYLGFHNSLVTITEGVRSQIYFGGILIDHSFDLISLSFFAILFILEICYLTMDLFNDANDNMVILLPRYGKKHIIYKDILIKMILRDCIVVVSDYLFFLFVEHTSNGLEDFKVIFMLLIEIFHLQMISYLFSFWKDSIIGYIVAFIVFFIPVMVCGFYFSMGNVIWKIWHYSLLHIPLFNWHNKLIIYYVEENYEWNTSNIDLLNFKSSCLISVISSAVLVWIGKFLCEKKQIL